MSFWCVCLHVENISWGMPFVFQGYFQRAREFLNEAHIAAQVYFSHYCFCWSIVLFFVWFYLGVRGWGLHGGGYILCLFVDLMTLFHLEYFASVFFVLFCSFHFFCCCLPWYNRNGWLGVKHQVSYLLLLCFCFCFLFVCVCAFFFFGGGVCFCYNGSCIALIAHPNI